MMRYGYYVIHSLWSYKVSQHILGTKKEQHSYFTFRAQSLSNILLLVFYFRVNQQRLKRLPYVISGKFHLAWLYLHMKCELFQDKMATVATYIDYWQNISYVATSDKIYTRKLWKCESCKKTYTKIWSGHLSIQYS